MDQLKDVILSTLAEIQESVPKEKEPVNNISEKPEEKREQSAQTNSVAQPKEKHRSKENFFSEVTAKQENKLTSNTENELLFLNSLRERMLVLFEGFQAPNNTSLEAKIDLTLNFLEYVLSTIDERIDKIKGK